MKGSFSEWVAAGEQYIDASISGCDVGLPQAVTSSVVVQVIGTTVICC